MYPKQQTFFVLGLSRSGVAAATFLLGCHAKTYLYDDVESEEIEGRIKQLEQKGAIRVHASSLQDMVAICDVLILSPGIPIDHPISVQFRRLGKAVIGETELAARYMRCPIIAVTGTNGKTTTVSMIEEVLQQEGVTARACGNIGAPMINFCGLGQEDVAVAEISSFQLETLNSIQPHIVAVLNVSEDHLNRHYNMENYIFLKSKMLKSLSPAEYAVLNYDDKTVRSFTEKTRAKCVYFSVIEKVDGAYYYDGALYYYEEKIMDANALLIGGVHNIQNALSAIVCAKLMGVKNENIAKALSNFKGIKHRVQFICEKGGVKYIDDSKGTNVDATIKAVNCMKSDTILLLGGKDKGYDYDKLFEELKSSVVRHSVLYGENRFRLLESAQKAGVKNISLCENMQIAIWISKCMAKPGETVLLSPASASFDAFSGYEERGDKFKEIIYSFEEKEISDMVEEMEIDCEKCAE